MRRNFLKKLFLIIGRDFLIVLISINSILGASVFSLVLSFLLARYGGSYEYDRVAFVVGSLGYIIVSGLSLYPIKKMLSPENTSPYWIGVVFGIPFLWYVHLYLLRDLIAYWGAG